MSELHRSGSYKTRAKRVRDAAYANELTRCWRCGKVLGDGKWTAGHIRDSDPTSPLAAEHASCNYRAGARLRTDGFRTSRDW